MSLVVYAVRSPLDGLPFFSTPLFSRSVLVKPRILKYPVEHARQIAKGTQDIILLVTSTQAVKDQIAADPDMEILT